MPQILFDATVAFVETDLAVSVAFAESHSPTTAQSGQLANGATIYSVVVEPNSETALVSTATVTYSPSEKDPDWMPSIGLYGEHSFIGLNKSPIILNPETHRVVCALSRDVPVSPGLHQLILS